MKKWIVMLLILALSLTTVACKKQEPEGDDTPKVIKIGYVENLTGKSSNSGSLCKRGIDLAHELNHTVNIGGVDYEIEIVNVDCKSDKVEAATCASRVIEQDKVVAILGPSNSGTNMAMTEIVEEAKIPAICGTATNPLVTQGYKYYFTACFTNNFHATVMAQFAYEAGYRKIAVVREIDTDAAVDCANRFIEIFKKLTGDPDCIVTEVGYNVADQDYNAQLVALKQEKFDAIFAPNTAANLALMMKQANDMGLETNWMGIDSCEVAAFLEIGGSSLIDRIYFSSFFDSGTAQTPATQKLFDEYAKRYDDVIAAHTAMSYDAYNLLVEGIRKAQSLNGDDIVKAMESIQNFEGASGYLSFNENHNVENQAVIKTVGEDMKFKYVTTVQAH